MEERKRAEISRLTEEYGGEWGINHTRRLLQLISHIGENLPYDEEVVWLAAHLHDWGAYQPWAQPGVEHVPRSMQVAGEFLAGGGYPAALIATVLECIEFHHRADAGPDLAPVLFRDADALDFLGAIGLARDFAKNPRDLRQAYMAVKARREKIPGLIHLERARALAADRIKRMDAFLAAFEEETFGYF